MKKKLVITAGLVFALVFGFLTLRGSEIEIFPQPVPLSNSPFSFPMPVASGRNVRRADRAEIDYSNVRDGYVMVRFLAETDNAVRVLITGPSEVRYQYHIYSVNEWEVFPLSDGNGRYTVGVFEQVEGNRFASVVSVNISVNLVDEFAPFLRPNQFVNFNRESRVVAKAAELAAGSESAIETVGRVYNFVIENIEYDFVLAANVRSGYVPDLDLALERGKGICFHYAALMTAMLRSQGIPTKLVIGYAGDVFHAWISVHTEETGWINNIIWFDGEEWHLMDPTFAATANQSDEVMRFIGDGTNYNPTHVH